MFSLFVGFWSRSHLLCGYEVASMACGAEFDTAVPRATRPRRAAPELRGAPLRCGRPPLEGADLARRHVPILVRFGLVDVARADSAFACSPTRSPQGGLRSRIRSSRL